MSEFLINVNNTGVTGATDAIVVDDMKVFVSRDELKEVLGKYRLQPGYTFEEIFPEFNTIEKIFIDTAFLDTKMQYFQTDAAGADDIYLELKTLNKTLVGAINEVHDEHDATVIRVGKAETELAVIIKDGLLLPDIIDVDQIKANAITATKIKADSIVTDHLTAGLITTDKIRADSIIAEQIKADAIKTKHLSANSIEAIHIKVDQIEAGHLKVDSVDANKIKADSIETRHIQANAITAGMIQVGQIKAEHITVGAVLAEHISANQIDAVHINSMAIETRHLKSDSIEAIHIKSDSIEARHIQVDSIDATKIKANEIDTHHLKANAIKAEQIDASAINAIHINTDAIVARHIAANAITTVHLSAESVGASNIQTGAIQAGSGIIANGAIGSAQISDLNANKVNAGTIDTSKVKVASQDATIEIYGNQLMINDTTDALNPKNRVILGEYVKGETTEFGLLVRSVDGQTVMIDGNGVHNAGITDGAVDNNKVSDTANISGTKLDIDSVVRTINTNGTETISGTKVQVGDRTLDVELSTQTQRIADGETELTSQKSLIQAMDNAIKLKVDSQEYISKITELEDSIPYQVNVISSNGQQFSNGNILTTLTVQVLKGNEDITNTIDDTQILWSRVSDDSEADNLWNDAHFNAGKSIQITYLDFFKKATFNATVMGLGIQLIQ